MQKVFCKKNLKHRFEIKKAKVFKKNQQKIFAKKKEARKLRNNKNPLF
jgi:hypothetical protein